MYRSFADRTFHGSQRAIGRGPETTASRRTAQVQQDWVLQLQRTVGNRAVARLLQGDNLPAAMPAQDAPAGEPLDAATANRDPVTRPEVSPEAAAVEIEGLLDQLFFDFEDQRRIIDLLQDVANARGHGVTPGELLGRVFSRLRSDRPSRLRMALHAPIAAATNAEPTYYDLLFDRFDAENLPGLIRNRDQTTYRGVGSASQTADQEKARKERQEEEKTARAEGWEYGPSECASLPRSSENIFLAKRVINQLASLPDKRLKPEERVVLVTVGRRGEDAAIDMLLTTCHQVTPGERRRAFRESLGKLVVSLAEWIVIDLTVELVFPLIVEGAMGTAETEALAAGTPAGEGAVGGPVAETELGEEAAAGETEALTGGKAAEEVTVESPVAQAVTGETKAAQVLEPAAPAPSAVDKALAQVERDIAEERSQVAALKQGMSRRAWARTRGGATKRLYNLLEHRAALARVKTFPGRNFLEQARIVGVRSGSKLTLTEEISASGKGRIADILELRGSKATLEDLKSASTQLKSVKGGLSSPEVEAEFRTSSKIAEQHKVEQEVIAEAKQTGGKVVVRGEDPITGSPVEVELDPDSIGSRVTDYTGLAN